MKAFQIPLLFFMALVGAGLIWRGLSRRRSLPCPIWMSGFVEGPLMDRVLGTKTTLDRIGLGPGLCVLELGPGPGRLLIPAAKQVLPGGEVVGLDIQPGMIELLKERAAQAGISNLKATLGGAMQFNNIHKDFDVVYLCTVLGEVPNREAALRQCYEALKPGGKLSITEIFLDPHYQSRATVKRLSEAAGFQLQAIYGSWYFFTANFVKKGGHSANLREVLNSQAMRAGT